MEVTYGLRDPGSPLTIGRVRLDMEVVAWTRDGKTLAEALVEGGDGCPPSTMIKPFHATEDYRDGPPTYALGAWLLQQ